MLLFQQVYPPPRNYQGEKCKTCIRNHAYLYLNKQYYTKLLLHRKKEELQVKNPALHGHTCGNFDFCPTK